MVRAVDWNLKELSSSPSYKVCILVNVYNNVTHTHSLLHTHTHTHTFYFTHTHTLSTSHTHTHTLSTSHTHIFYFTHTHTLYFTHTHTNTLTCHYPYSWLSRPLLGSFRQSKGPPLWRRWSTLTMRMKRRSMKRGK